ncbi:MAG TPA: FHA domain-containing protein [Labilithrix sp.]|nr:FHA domain-containing protein [Labilithrix sp.]
MTDDSRLKSWADAQRNAAATHPASEHIDVDTLTRHAAGQLSPPVARVVSEHLFVCEDGRCVEFVRSLGAEVDATSASHYDAVPPMIGGARQRTFQSREIIWATFESMSRELDIPIDDLVNHAMAAYARVRGYSVPPEPMTTHGRRDPLEETHDAPAASALDVSYAPPRPPTFEDDDLARTGGHLAMATPAGGRGAHPEVTVTESRTTPRVSPLSSGASSRSGGATPSGRRLPPPPPHPPSSRGGPAFRSSIGNSAPPPLPPRVMPPSSHRLPDAPRSSNPPSSSSAKHLVLSYRGRAHPVEKERFLLGRSKTQADLRLDDPNVSRQHAVIERVGAAWYIVDLGSTNGVHVAGERVARRALSDGDVIVITSHEIHCSLR